MDAGVEGSDGPHGGHHGQAELPALGPVGVVLHLGEDEVAVVEAALVDFGADGDGDEEEDQQARVGDGGDGLQHGDVFRGDAGGDTLEDDAGRKDAVGLARGDLEVAVFGEVDGGKDLLGVTVGDGDGACAEGHGVGEADQEGERDPDALRGVVEGPVVQAAGGGDCGGQLGHGDADGEDEHGGDEPRPQEACRPGREPRGGDGGHRGKDAHDGVRDSEDLERGEPPLELLLVADLGKQGFVVDGGLGVELLDVGLMRVDLVHPRLQRGDDRGGRAERHGCGVLDGEGGAGWCETRRMP